MLINMFWNRCRRRFLNLALFPAAKMRGEVDGVPIAELIEQAPMSVSMRP